MKKRTCKRKKISRLIFRAALMMVLLDLFLIAGYHGFFYNPPDEPAAAATRFAVQELPQHALDPRAALDVPLIFDDLPQPAIHSNHVPTTEQEKPGLILKEKKLKADRDPMDGFSVPGYRRLQNARVVIIIDDMGLDPRSTRSAMSLPGPMTLSFLPYGRNLERYVAEAQKHGHEVLVHMPMEPLDATLDPGPDALRADMSREALLTALEKNLAALTGYVGINNHMGSKLTQSRRAMALVMEVLHRRGLLFVDSRTIDDSVAEEMAAQFNVDHATRDVFLDHVETAEGVKRSLQKLEDIAYRRGFAIAIGHPKAVTLDGLRAWLPTLKEKGLTLVPVSAVVTQPVPAPLSAALP